MTASLAEMDVKPIKKPNSYAALWDEMFTILTAYKDEHGDVNVPRGIEFQGIKIGMWVGKQRTSRSQGKMSQDRIDRLDGLGMMWSAQVWEVAWQEKYALLLAYREEFGTVDVPAAAIYRGVRLKTWLNSQKKASAKSKLSQERADLLNEIGAMEPNRRSWTEAYSLLLAYKSLHGSANVPQHHAVDGYGLGQWLRAQRAFRSAGSLLPDRLRLLDEAGVTWSIQRTAWDDALDILTAYRDENGDANAPDGLIYRGFPLGTWLQTQRRENRLGKISDERVARLDALGMVWNFNDTNWDRNFALVAEYAKAHGTANVPQAAGSPNLELAGWVGNQRSAMKEGTLTAERQQKLEALGITWDVREQAWSMNFELFEAWVSEHGKPRVPQGFVTAGGVKLGFWYHRQLALARAGTLPPERRQLLTDLGVRLRGS